MIIYRIVLYTSSDDIGGFSGEMVGKISPFYFQFYPFQTFEDKGGEKKGELKSSQKERKKSFKNEMKPMFKWIKYKYQSNWV